MDYNHHMGYVDKSDRMANSYSTSRRTFKWTKKLFFVCYTWPFSIATSCIPLVGVRRFHIEIFDLPSWEICCHMLDQNGEYQGHLKVKSMSLGLKSAAASIGLPRLRRNWGVGSVRLEVWQGKFSGSAVSVKWVCASKILVLKITTHRHSCNNITCDLLQKNCGIKPICK